MKCGGLVVNGKYGEERYGGKGDGRIQARWGGLRKEGGVLL